MNKRIYSTRELAQIWNVSESTIKRWADRGELCCYRTPGGHRKFHLQDICNFQKQRGFEATGLLTTEKWEDPEIEEALNRKRFDKVRQLIHYLALQNQRGRIRDLMERLYMRGMGLADLYDEVLIPIVERGQRELENEEISIGQEKLLRNNLEEAMSILFPELIRRRQSGRTGLCGAPDDPCRISVNALSRIMEVEGWDCLNLGSRVPCTVMAEMVDEEPVNLVCVACAESDTLNSDDFETLAEVAGHHRIPLVLVGNAFTDPQVRKELSHDDYFPDFRSFQSYLIHLSSR